MSILHDQTLYELGVTQGFTNDLAANLNTQGVAASNTEGLDTLVPKVLEIESGEAKTPYDEWQEGFNANWDSVIQNAPQTGVNPVLHIYSKTNSIRHTSTFPTTVTIVTYNPTTGIYRPVVLDTNKNLFFEESDYFMNNYDGLYYTCVIYMASRSFGDWYFRTTLPVVYSNTRAVDRFANEQYIDCISEISGGATSFYPLLRGVDLNMLNGLNLYNGIEHISCMRYNSSLIVIRVIQGGNLAIGLLSVLISEMPLGTSISFGNNGQLFTPYISNEKLANWFYNIFIQTYLSSIYYVISSTGVCRQFKINKDMVLAANSNFNQLHSVPNAMYLTGTITEDQTATTYAGYHGFNLTAYTLLRNFPMWTVLEGASYGCLKPMTVYSTRGNFRFSSYNLERDYFAQFDELGELILDPTLTFVANLPIETVTGATITFDDKTFKNKFTAAEQTKIVDLVTNIKNWTLAW